MNHTRWRTARERAVRGESEPPHISAEREQIRLAMMLGRLVYDRRNELGLSEDDLAIRLGTSPEQVEHIELGGVLPITSDLLLRLAAALDVSVDVHLAASGTAVTFGAHAA